MESIPVVSDAQLNTSYETQGMKREKYKIALHSLIWRAHEPALYTAKSDRAKWYKQEDNEGERERERESRQSLISFYDVALF